MPTVQKVYFQSRKLVTTVLPPKARPEICPSDTCCGPPSAGCRYTLLFPNVAELNDTDLRRLIGELRTRLNVEQQGIEIIIPTRSDKEYSSTIRTLEDAIGPSVDKPEY